MNELIYKLKFGIKVNKLSKGDIQLGIFLNKQNYDTLANEYYLYVVLFKWSISIGWFLEDLN